VNRPFEASATGVVTPPHSTAASTAGCVPPQPSSTHKSRSPGRAAKPKSSNSTSGVRARSSGGCRTRSSDRSPPRTARRSQGTCAWRRKASTSLGLQAAVRTSCGSRPEPCIHRIASASDMIRPVRVVDDTEELADSHALLIRRSRNMLPKPRDALAAARRFPGVTARSL
jgi:hypothetical protein